VKREAERKPRQPLVAQTQKAHDVALHAQRHDQIGGQRVEAGDKRGLLRHRLGTLVVVAELRLDGRTLRLSEAREAHHAVALDKVLVDARAHV
jgi:hypothetical protein